MRLAASELEKSGNGRLEIADERRPDELRLARRLHWRQRGASGEDLHLRSVPVGADDRAQRGLVDAHAEIVFETENVLAEEIVLHAGGKRLHRGRRGGE